MEILPTILGRCIQFSGLADEGQVLQGLGSEEQWEEMLSGWNETQDMAKMLDVSLG